MKSEHWMQIIVGGIILVTLGFLGSNLFEMKGLLSTVKSKVDTTDNRLARIADVLPEVKARVAWEEVNNPIDGFIAVFDPNPIDNENTVTLTVIYDASSGEIKVHSIELDNNHQNYAAYAIAGKLVSETPYDASFSELAMHSASLKQMVTMPASINAETSFIIRSAKIEDINGFVDTFSSSPPYIKNVGVYRNWGELSPKLNDLLDESNLTNQTNGRQ